MPLAVYKDLCIDARDANAMGTFWATALGLQLEPVDATNASLIGTGPAHTVWINQVSESKAVKNRIHLDVYGSSSEELQTIGASVIDDTSFRWIVMADPEGGEFCLFVKEQPPTYRLYELVVDCVDHESLSRWWARTIGGDWFLDDRGFSGIRQIPNAPFEAISFLAVDEPKAAKNRVHIDVFADDVAPLLSAGATLLRPSDDQVRWDVLADPEGNEFCVFETSKP